jgi:hypothetical protein
MVNETYQEEHTLIMLKGTKTSWKEIFTEVEQENTYASVIIHQKKQNQKRGGKVDLILTEPL